MSLINILFRFRQDAVGGKPNTLNLWQSNQIFSLAGDWKFVSVKSTQLCPKCCHFDSWCKRKVTDGTEIIFAVAGWENAFRDGGFGGILENDKKGIICWFLIKFNHWLLKSWIVWLILEYASSWGIMILNGAYNQGMFGGICNCEGN